MITPDDLVCVTPEMRDQVAEDNALAEERKDPACADADAPAMDDVQEEPDAGAPPEPEGEDEAGDAEPPDTAETRPAPDAPSEGESSSGDSETERPDRDDDGLEVFNDTEQQRTSRAPRARAGHLAIGPTVLPAWTRGEGPAPSIGSTLDFRPLFRIRRIKEIGDAHAIP